MPSASQRSGGCRTIEASRRKAAIRQQSGTRQLPRRRRRDATSASLAAGIRRRSCTAGGRARVTERHHAIHECLDETVLKTVRGELFLLLGVGDESHLDEDGRHVRTNEDTEGRLLNGTLAHRDTRSETTLDG